MKHSRGNLIATILPILILASVAAAGWYYYYSELNKNDSLAMESDSDRTKLNSKLEQLQTTIKNLQEDQTSLQAGLESEKKSLNDEISTVSGERSQLLTQLEQEQESKKQIANLKTRLERELNESRVEISQLKNQMTVIKLTSEVLFSSGSAEIRPAGQKVLSIIAESLNANPRRAISVEGHTDNVPVLNNDYYESNWELSAARALAAVNYFQQNNHVEPTRLRVVGYGEYRPVSSNKTAEGRKLNRRIEIRLLPLEVADVIQNQQVQ